MSKEIIVDETPAPVDDHPYKPQNEVYWGLCEQCGLAAAAHKTSTVSLEVTGPYRCPDCVKLDEDLCLHRMRQEDPITPLPVPEVHISEAEEWTVRTDTEDIKFSGTMCTNCGGMMIQSGSCETCSSCGTTTGCG